MLFWKLKKKEERQFSDDSKTVVKFLWEQTVNDKAKWQWDGVGTDFSIKFLWECEELGCDFRIAGSRRKDVELYVRMRNGNQCIAVFDAENFATALRQALGEEEYGEIEVLSPLKGIHAVLMQRFDEMTRNLKRGAMGKLADSIRIKENL